MRLKTLGIVCLVISTFLCLQGCGSDPYLASITVVPTSGTAIIQAQQTAQFKAYGNYIKTNSTTYSKDITSQVQWQSWPTNVATIDSSGNVTGVSAGVANITATVASRVGNSNVAVNPGSGVPSITLIGVGNGSGTVTSKPGPLSCTVSAGTTTGTCYAFFSTPTTITLTATPASGSSFGGWSANCQPNNQPTCTVDVAASDNVTVIFN